MQSDTKNIPDKDTPKKITPKKPQKKKPKNPHVERRKNKFLEVFWAKRGRVSEACKAANIGRTTVYQWINEDADFNSRFYGVKEDLIDYVESKLLERAEGVVAVKQTKDGPVIYELPPDTRACVEYLKAHAKNRGWTPKFEVSTNANNYKRLSIPDDAGPQEATQMYLDYIKGLDDEGY